MTKIAILGWGSLVWDPRPEFDRWHDPWRPDGPALELEFSRISASRKGALTLVIDPQHGALNPVAYSISRRTVLADAIADLQWREGTTSQNIGYVGRSSNSNRWKDRASGATIEAWAAVNGVEAVVWTDLPSNFEEKLGQPFSIGAAIGYLRKLDPSSRAKAAEYVRRAPPFIQTPLRRALAAEAWFVTETEIRHT